MVVYNLYLLLNDELVQIYDKKYEKVEYKGSSNDIPIKFMNRIVHCLNIIRIDGNNYQLIVID